MQGASGALIDGLVVACVDTLDLGVVLGIAYECRGCLYVGNEYGGCIRVNRGIWNEGDKVRCLGAAVHCCNIAALSARQGRILLPL